MSTSPLVEYDHGQGGGDGLPTAIVHPLDDSESRVEYLAHDYRHRRVGSYVQTGDTGIAYGYRYDDRDLLVEREHLHVYTPGPPIPPGSMVAALISGGEEYPSSTPLPVARPTHRTRLCRDERGRVYRRREYGIDALGDTAGSVDEESWYDPDGNLIKRRDMGAAAVTKFRYDSLGRLRATYLAVESGSTRSGCTNSVDDDTVIEETRYKYNDAGHLVAQKACARFDDASGSGRLRRDNEPRSRNSYVARYCDPLGRLRFLADFGTNGGVSWTRPGLHPETSDSVLVTEHAYGYDGLLRKTVDPEGTETRWKHDHAGRIVEESKGPSDTSGDFEIVRYEYDENKLYRLICVNWNEEEQVSHWGYSTHLESSDLASWNLVSERASPTGKVEYFFYNRQGEVKKFVDANGTVHEYIRDGAGRLVHDCVTTLASGVDGKIRRISRTYDDRGLLKLVTCHDDKDVGEGRVVNEVAFYYNEYGMLVREVQSHWGDRHHSDAREVGYTYETDGTTGAVRRTGVTYPSDKAIQYQYSSDSIGDAINRVRTVTGPARGDGTGTGIVLAQFEYLGASVPAVADFPEPGLQHTWKMQPGDPTGDAGDPYVGYDRFGRTVRSRWLRPGSSSLPHVDVSWGYDRRFNKVWRRDLVAPDLAPSPVPEHDQRAEYDALSRITGWKRGMLDLLTFDIASPAEQEAFEYDRPGNWTSYRRHVGGTLRIDQSRVHNKANQIVEVDGKSSKLAYDDNGNMRKYPADRDLDGSVRSLRWDAWNRLRRILNSSDTWLAWFGYDGLGRRIYREDNPTISDYDRHYFYDDRWQVIEEGWHESDSNGDAIPGTLRAVGQYVWRPDARGQLILRDRSLGEDSSLDERCYALRDELDVVAIADHGGEVLERYAYTPFGVHTIMDAGYGERSGNDSDYEWSALFHGHFLDDGRNIYCIGHRYYRPKLGRWLSGDPAGYVDGPNLYAYVGQNPWNFIDPLGLWEYNESMNHWKTESNRSDVSIGYKMYAGFRLMGAALNPFQSDSAIRATSREFGEGVTQAAEEIDKSPVPVPLKGVAKFGLGVGSAGHSLNPINITADLAETTEAVRERGVAEVVTTAVSNLAQNAVENPSMVAGQLLVAGATTKALAGDKIQFHTKGKEGARLLVGIPEGTQLSLNAYTNNAKIAPMVPGVGFNILDKGSRTWGLELHRFNGKAHGRSMVRLHRHSGSTKSQISKHRHLFSDETY